jgi:bifunctional NMN adenylyltransferase/nudix hydrolase
MNNNKNTSKAKVALLIGRFQILHRAHTAMLREALDCAERVIVILGSAWHSRDPKNPFTWQERQQQFDTVLTAQERERVSFIPVRDYYDDARWTESVIAAVGAVTTRGERIVLVGHKKDQSTDYLDYFPGWEARAVPSSLQINASDLRRIYFEAENLDIELTVIGNYVEPGVLSYLRAWSKTPAYRRVAAEHRAVEADRLIFTAPYYLTADTLLRVRDRVLLVRRGGSVGRGLLALPGGFLDKNEQFYAGALRELAEETGYRGLATTMRNALKGQAVFDHPARSPRNRIITTAFYFDLGDVPFPQVRALDDADEVEWVLISELATLEDQFFEDHAGVLDHFLQIFSQESAKHLAAQS